MGRWLVVCLCLLLALAGGCAAPAAAPTDAAAPEVQALLDRRAAAVLAHDTDAHLAALDPAATALRAAARTELANLADVPLSSWSYRLTGLERGEEGRATARVDLSYRIRGHDSGAVTHARVLELTERDGRWYVSEDRPGEHTPQQLWQQGPVRVVQGERSIVMGVGQSVERLRAIAATADTAVPAVSAGWPERWAGRLVVLVPASVDAMGGLLGAPAAGYRGIAAVTTGESGGGPDAPADRVIVNPEAYGVLGEYGQRIVLTHETTHVATRAYTSASTPMWLSEGFADWVAYRDSARTAAETAPELHDAVHSGAAPAALPEDADFSFTGNADALARAYEGGWLACELIAERWGEPKLAAFYRAVGAHPSRAGAVEKAMDTVLSTTPERFTADWRQYVRERLGR